MSNAPAARRSSSGEAFAWFALGFAVAFLVVRARSEVLPPLKPAAFDNYGSDGVRRAIGFAA